MPPINLDFIPAGFYNKCCCVACQELTPDYVEAEVPNVGWQALMDNFLPFSNFPIVIPSTPEYVDPIHVITSDHPPDDEGEEIVTYSFSETDGSGNVLAGTLTLTMRVSALSCYIIFAVRAQVNFTGTLTHWWGGVDTYTNHNVGGYVAGVTPTLLACEPFAMEAYEAIIGGSPVPYEFEAVESGPP